MRTPLKIIVLVCLALLTAVPSVRAQGVIFNFSQDKSTYLWEDSIWLDNNLSHDIHLQLANHSTATLIKKSLFLGSGDRWQKDADTRMALTFNNSGKFTYGINAYNNYSRLENRRVTINQLGIQQDYQLSQKFSFNSLLAYSETARDYSDNTNRDQGVMQKFNMNFRDGSAKWGQFEAGYNHELNMLENTPEKTFGLNLGYNKLTKSTQVQVGYVGSYRQSKFYSQLTTFEQITKQDRYEHSGDLQLSLNPWRKLNLNLISNYSYRRFDYKVNTSDKASDLVGRDNLTATMYYKLGADYPLFGRSLLDVEYIYRKSDEEFGDVLSGQEITLGELRLAYHLRIGPRDSLQATGAFSVTSYTGKDPDNIFSDRDKVYKSAQGIYQHQFSPYFIARMRGSYQYNHYIFVSGELSANNNHDIIYLIQPELLWVPHTNLNITQSFVMHANYIYFDFEKYEDSPRNTIYRKADYQAIINYAFSPSLFLKFTYRYRYEDFGQLIYRDQWAQRISWERKGHLPSFEMEWQPYKNLMINPGYSYERKHSFDHLAGEIEGQTLLNEKELFKRQLIFINIEYRPSAKGVVEFTYTRRVQESLQFSDDDSDIFTLNIRRYF